MDKSLEEIAKALGFSKSDDFDTSGKYLSRSSFTPWREDMIIFKKNQPFLDKGLYVLYFIPDYNNVNVSYVKDEGSLSLFRERDINKPYAYLLIADGEGNIRTVIKSYMEDRLAIQPQLEDVDTIGEDTLFIRNKQPWEYLGFEKGTIADKIKQAIKEKRVGPLPVHKEPEPVAEQAPSLNDYLRVYQNGLIAAGIMGIAVAGLYNLANRIIKNI